MKDFEYSTTRNGKFIKVPRMQDCIDAILIRYNDALDKISRLEETNKKLRSEHYKDEELQKMKQEVKDIKEDYYRGFPITKEEKEAIDKWKRQHEEEVHCLHTLEDRLRAGGTIGGSYHYEFIPTSIGTIGKVVCSCGEEFVFCDLC